MNIGLGRIAVLVATLTTALSITAPAAAAPVRHKIGWLVTEATGGTPVAPDAPPQTNSNPPRTSNISTLATPADDLKQVCRSQHTQEASTKQGWMADRFNRCWIGHRNVVLRCLNCPTMIASVEFDYTLVGIAQNGTRQVDFTLTFDNWLPLGGEERETTPFRVSLSGCGSLVSCNPALGEFTQPLGSWRLAPTWQVTMTSANNTGVGSEFLATSLVTMSMAITPLSANIQPWVENNMTTGQVRFDSAGAVAGKYNGTVFSDFTPTYNLVALARADNNEDGVRESILHIDDALHHIERTFPSFIGKSPPGEYKASLGANQRPLHRTTSTTDKNNNRTYAGKVCDDVWGSGAATPNLNCDEYPMASTKEGAYTGSSASSGNTEGWRTWNGSSRIIGEVDNQDSGRQYLNIGFYQPNRILNNDPFFVAINR
ncbi:hypothetical protein MRQ36_27590 [Micromonospora sp. R77]|uniref:NucA/NucB deoxyribonuclease domain-containing protein n=1 Tax=Micromonospora sp. R77 TaxID=2925836 RepID=UPI001F60F20F|nr:hypothetical protein [Micromonospora sp. R77]MCI4066107.1 hypothetical protein [Micromonospora sp. R77]